jgi:hypothetical protein
MFVNTLKDFSMAEQTGIFVEPWLCLIMYCLTVPAIDEGSEMYFEICYTNFIIGNGFE